MDLDTLLRYVAFPLLTAICTVGWFMFKKHDARIDKIENSVFSTEKEVIEIRTAIRKDIQYLSQDVKEIKDMISKISTKK